MFGSTRPKDFELLMQMIYAYFTDLNYDEEAFETYKSKQNSFMANMSAMPQFYYQEQFYGYLMEDNPRFNGILPSAEDWDNANYKKAYAFYKQQFANARDFHFFLVGNVDLAEVEELATTYIASLPSNESKDEMLDLGYRMKKGDIKKVVKKGTDPKSTVNIMMYGDIEYNAEEAMAMKALGEILTIKLIEELRENESGVYGVSANGRMSKVPYGSFNFSIQFPCGPENAEQLTASALRELDKIIAEGPTAKDLDKFKEAQRVDFKEKSQENSFWMGQLADAYTNQKSPDKMLEYLDRVGAIEATQIQEVAKKYLTQNRVIGMHMPEDE
jgi:zinc protease